MHNGGLTGVASLGGMVVTVGAQIGHHPPAVRFWDPSDGHLIATADVDAAYAIDAAGRRMIIGAITRAVVFDATTSLAGRVLYEQPDRLVRAVALSADGSVAAVATGDCVVHVISLATPAPERTVTCAVGEPSSVAISGDAAVVAVSGAQGGFAILRIRDGGVELAHADHQSSGSALRFVPNSHDVLEARDDRTFARWRPGTVNPVYETRKALGNSATAIAVSPDGKLAAVAVASAGVAVFDVATGASKTEIESGGYGVAFVSDRDILVGTHAGHVVRIDATTGTPTGTLAGIAMPASSVGFIAEDRLLALDRQVHAYALATPDAAPTMPLAGDPPRMLEVPAVDKSRFVVVDGNRTVRVVDSAHMRPGRSLTGLEGWLHAVAPDGRYGYATEFGSFERVDLATMKVVPFVRAPKEVECVAPGKGGAVVAIAARDGKAAVIPKLALWSWKTANAPPALVPLDLGGSQDVFGCALATNGDVALATDTGMVVVSAAGKVRMLLADRMLFGVSSDPARARIAFTDSNDLVGIIDLATGAVTELGGHDGRIDSLAFAPSGHTLASASQDGSIVVWATP